MPVPANWDRPFRRTTTEERRNGREAILGAIAQATRVSLTQRRGPMKRFAGSMVLMAALLTSSAGCSGCNPRTTAGPPVGGRVGGPADMVQRVGAFSSNFYQDQFRGGAPAVVSIAGDGDTDLDLFIYDASGRLVVYAIGPTDRETVSWTPPATGFYRVEVRNLGGVWNEFRLRTN
jgi:hypothetical protein